MSETHRKRRLLVISQVYVPDPAAVGQYMADAAKALVERGYDVRVLASARGYDDPSQRYPNHETLDGVEVQRLPFSSFGKRNLLVRVAAQGLFLIQAIVRGLLTPRLAGIVVSTSPPMASIAALVIRFVRRKPITFWVMDLNPDQVVATGHLGERHPAVLAFNWLNRRILNASRAIVPLDRFMAQRLYRKVDVADKTVIVPPWPMEDDLEIVPRDDNPFIQQHGLSDKRIVMYSGNHGVTTPLDSLVAAALALQSHPRLHFMFIGGGPGKQPVDDAIKDQAPSNLVSLPYQPLSQIRYSLSAADVHLVLMDEKVVGIVHPCKVYGAMAVAKPILFMGPVPSHISEILGLAGDQPIGWHVPYGDIPRMKEVLCEIESMSRDDLAAMGRRARQLIDERFNKPRLCGLFCDVVCDGPRFSTESSAT